MANDKAIKFVIPRRSIFSQCWPEGALITKFHLGGPKREKKKSFFFRLKYVIGGDRDNHSRKPMCQDSLHSCLQ